jgi:hypothetical protein
MTPIVNVLYNTNASIRGNTRNVYRYDKVNVAAKENDDEMGVLDSGKGQFRPSVRWTVNDAFDKTIENRDPVS